MVENNKLGARLISEVEQQVADLYETFEQYQQQQEAITHEKIQSLEQQANLTIQAYEQSEHEKMAEALAIVKQNQQTLCEEQIRLLHQEIKNKETVLVDSILKEVFSRYGS